MESRFGALMQSRRSYYEIGGESPVTDQTIREIVEHAVKHTPSPMNSQGSRAVLLLHRNHGDFWDLVMRSIRDVNPGKDLSASEEKVAGFKAGYGTVLFFYDRDVTAQMAEEEPLYKDTFAEWSKQESAMQQFAVWNMLEEAGFGATLQHYNPIVDNYVYERWDISKSWQLNAEMPFGLPTGPPWVGKEFEDIHKRVLVFP